MQPVLSILREVRDPRAPNARHELSAILFIALAATLCSQKSCVHIADFGAVNAAELAEIVDLPHGAPSHDCFSRVFRLLDPAELAKALASFVGAIRDGLDLDAPRGVVAVDGKSLRKAYERGRACAPPLMVSVWDAETRVSIAAARAPGVSLLECAHRRRMERAVVALQAQRIIGTAGQHTFGHPRMTMKGIGRDDAAFQDQGLQQCQGGSDLIAARSPRGRYRYAGLGIPDTHHQRRRTGTTAFIGLAQGLPIHRDDAPGSAEIQTVADRTDKAGERLGEFGGVEQAEHPAETIMAGRTMRQLDDLGQLGRVDRPEGCGHSSSGRTTSPPAR